MIRERLRAGVARWKPRAVLLGERLAAKPMRSLLPLILLAAGIEIAQYWPERVAGGHASGEIVRNLAYALIGALIFQWIIVEMPERRRRRAAYEFNRLAFEVLVSTGASLIAIYRHARPPGAPELDSWSEESVAARASAIAAHSPEAFGNQRANTLRHVILGVQLALDGMRVAQSYFDADVAHALALFPGSVGIRQLQVLPTPDGSIHWGNDARIVWELIEAGRRLYPALRSNVPYISFHIGVAELDDGTKVFAQESDLIAAPDEPE